MAVPQFRGDEQFLPPDDSFPERVAQSLSHFFFVSVNRRAVDVTVSDAQSLLDGPVSFRGFRSPGSQSELRNRVPVFECGVFHNPISLMTECDMQRSYFSGCGSTGRRNIVDGFRDGTEHDGVRAGNGLACLVGRRRRSFRTVFPCLLRRGRTGRFGLRKGSGTFATVWTVRM